MLCAHCYAHTVLRVAADALDIGKGGAGNHKTAVFHIFAFDLLAALGQTVAVNGNQSQLAVLYFKEGAGVDGAHIAVGHGKNRLVDHGFQQLLGQVYMVQAVHAGHFRIIVCADSHEVKLAFSAFYIDVVVFIGADADNAVRQAADHFAEKPRSHNNGAGLLDIRADIGVYAFFQVVAGNSHICVRLDQQTFKSRDRAFGCCCS